MRDYLTDSQLTRKRADHLYKGEHKETVFKDKVQEYYSLRCVPQILGAIYETLSQAKEVATRELNSANDNPIIDMESQQVYHGGNFHGDYISLEMDKLKLAITRLSMLSERQLNYLLNPKINEILPALSCRQAGLQTLACKDPVHCDLHNGREPDSIKLHVCTQYS